MAKQKRASIIQKPDPIIVDWEEYVHNLLTRESNEYQALEHSKFDRSSYKVRKNSKKL